MLGCPPSHTEEGRLDTVRPQRAWPPRGAVRPAVPPKLIVTCGVPSSWGCRALESGGTFFNPSPSLSALDRSRRLVLWGKLGFIASRRPAKVQRVRRPHLACRPGYFFTFHFFRNNFGLPYLKGPSPLTPDPRCLGRAERVGSGRKQDKQNEKTTLGGGSLGSCVDEERSQLRELM